MLVILYVHPLIFSMIFFLFSKVSLIFMYMDIRYLHIQPFDKIVMSRNYCGTKFSILG